MTQGVRTDTTSTLKIIGDVAIENSISEYTQFQTHEVQFTTTGSISRKHHLKK